LRRRAFGDMTQSGRIELGSYPRVPPEPHQAALRADALRADDARHDNGHHTGAATGQAGRLEALRSQGRPRQRLACLADGFSGEPARGPLTWT
jgi:hypothetical protein